MGLVRPLYGLFENIFLRQAQGQRHAPVARQKLADHGNRRALYVFEQQSRTVGPFVENLANRAQLMLRVHLSGNRVQLARLFQSVEKLA